MLRAGDLCAEVFVGLADLDDRGVVAVDLDHGRGVGCFFIGGRCGVRWGSGTVAGGLRGACGSDHRLELLRRDAGRADAECAVSLRVNRGGVQRGDGDVGGDEVIGEAGDGLLELKHVGIERLDGGDDGGDEADIVEAERAVGGECGRRSRGD